MTIVLVIVIVILRVIVDSDSKNDGNNDSNNDNVNIDNNLGNVQLLSQPKSNCEHIISVCIFKPYRSSSNSILGTLHYIE